MSEIKKYSKMFPLVKGNFDKGLWDINLVKMAVKKGYIAKDEFAEITGEEY